MALNSSGQLSLGGATAGESVNLELGKSATALVSFNDTDLRTLFGVASGQISMSTGYGKSSYTIDSTRGYILGGWIVPGGGRTQIDGLVFASESTIDPGAALTDLNVISGTINSAQRGYALREFVGGNIDGIRFSDESTIDPAATVSISPSSSLADGDGILGVNSANKGYLTGASNSMSFTFSTEASGTVGAGLVQGRRPSGGGCSQTRGYYAGGVFSPVGGYTQIDGIDFASETTIDPGASLVQGRSPNPAVNSSTRCYWAGGYEGSSTNPGGQIDGLQFSTESQIDPGAGIVQGRWGAGSVNSPTRGYWMGGATHPTTYVNVQAQIDGINFASESTIDPGAGLVQARSGGGVQNSNN